MSNYKDTLNLPNTAFPMKANLAMREPEILNSWKENNLYKKIREKRNGSKKFIWNTNRIIGVLSTNRIIRF